MHRYGRHAALVGMAALAAMTVYAPVLGGDAQEPGPPACPTFALRDTLQTIDVVAAGGQFTLGNGTVITFPAGALPTERASYQVRPAPVVNARRLAGFTIEAQGNSPTEFAEPVSIRVSYAGCPFENSNRPLWLVTNQSGRWERVGGARSRSGKYVQAEVNHFSAFAIAQ